MLTLIDRYLAHVPLSRIGFEIELLAPDGSTRRDLAAAIAATLPGGEVCPTFQLDAEPSMVPGMGTFHNLTPAFEVRTGHGELVCRLVDDVTIWADLDRDRPALPGWYRVVSDDRRLLGLVQRHCRAGSPMRTCLDPIAELFGVTAEGIGGFVRVNDASGATVAMAAPLPGERHRVCEVITPVLTGDPETRLEELLTPARALGFTIPAEAAVHVHFDAGPFRSPRALRNLARLVMPRLGLLRAMVGTNPRCRRLGPLPPDLSRVTEGEEFLHSGWDDARRMLAGVGLDKYMDVNLANLLNPPPGKDTIEWRILPGALEAGPIIAGARLFQALSDRALGGEPVPVREVATTRAEAEALVAELSG